MSNLFWLTDAQMARLQPFFPKSHGKPRVDDRRVLSGIIFINRNGLRWCDAPKEYGPPKTLYNRWKRWSGKGVFARMMDGLAAEATVPKTVMIDATYLKAHRTATSLRSKKGAGDTTSLFVHAIGAQVFLNLPLAMDPHCRQVVEDDREVAIHQRPDLLGEFHLDPFGMVHQGIHGAQQMLVGHALGHGRHGHGVQPAQHAQLAVGRTEAVEHHGAHQAEGMGLAPNPL